MHSPADLAAVTLSAPPVSDDAPRTTFSRIRGRPGRHQADPGQASFFSRPPMTPLTASGTQAPAEAGPSEAGPPGQEDAEDTGWGATSWDRQGPAGSMGSRRSGG